MKASSELRPARLESVRCALCADDRPVYVRRLRDLMFGTTPEEFTLVRCQSCGLLYLNPRPAPSDLGALYPDDYTPFRRRGITRRVREWQYRRSARALWSLLAPPGIVLDIGCGAGELLAAVRAAGNPNVLGVEPNPAASAIAREKRGLNVITGAIFDARLEAGSIDAVLLSHVFEHLPDPAETLAEIARVLRPGGSIVLWLPNAGSLPARLLGDYWMGWDAPRHLYAYTPDTLERMLVLHGFVVQEVYHERNGIEWSWGLRLLARDRLRAPLADRILAALHPVVGIAATPLATLSALLGRAGRVRVVARLRPGGARTNR
jgi:SAM-dependent methyltransferase